MGGGLPRGHSDPVRSRRTRDDFPGTGSLPADPEALAAALARCCSLAATVLRRPSGAFDTHSAGRRDIEAVQLTGVLLWDPISPVRPHGADEASVMLEPAQAVASCGSKLTPEHAAGRRFLRERPSPKRVSA